MSDFRLSDLLDLNIIQKMADAHYRAAGMPIGIIDAIDDSVLVGSGWQDICVKFHRANPELCHRCQASDNYIKEHLVVGEACHYKCQNGLWDIGMPIVVEGRHLATMFLGQFFYEEEVPDRAFFTQLAHDFGFEVDDYLAALDRVPVFSHEKVESILDYDKALVGFLADLAEHAILKSKADGMIRASERKFHAIFDQTQHFLGLLSTEGNVLDVNRTALAFTGADETDFIGKPLWETPWWCDSSGRQRDLRQAVEKAAQGELIRFEATQSTDGNIRVLDISIKPVTDEGGKVVLLIAEGRDITEGRQAEEEIKRQAQFLQIVIDAMPYPVFYKDRLGRYLGCNRAYERFFGVLRGKIAGKTVYEVAPKELAEIYYRTDEALLAHPGTQTYEACIETADEGRHDVIFHKATFEGTDGTLAGIVGAVVDITERKQAEQEKRKLQEQLAVAQKMESVGRLAGGVAHDFNNMLAVILGNAELALNKLSQADAVFPNLEVIQKAAERSADLCSTSTRPWVACSRC
jgi:PAS domain S-box-containing protein